LSEAGWLDRLTAGFRKTSDRLGDNLTGLFTKAQLDEAVLDQIEEALIASDLGPETAAKVRSRLAEEHYEIDLTEARVRAIVAEELEQILEPVAVPLEIDAFPRPQVILVVGVNGSGKTTTIAKLAHRFSTRGARVLLAAADTFRAAAIEQLQVWAGRVNVPVVAHAPGADPSAVVFDALDAAAARGSDVVIADTAGRLHTKSNLMDELAKIRRTINKRLPEATPEVLFVLDATTGQNGLNQAKAFHDAAPLSGIVLTKLDSTARGGIAFAIEDALDVPVLFVGVGEKVDDLLDFNPNAFVEALFA
jgi:fused signal recognition particle receptor